MMWKKKNKPCNGKDHLSHFLSYFFSIVYHFGHPTDVNTSLTWHWCQQDFFYCQKLYDKFCNWNNKKYVMNSTAFYHSHSNVLGVPTVWACHVLLPSFGLRWSARHGLVWAKNTCAALQRDWTTLSARGQWVRMGAWFWQIPGSRGLHNAA